VEREEEAHASFAEHTEPVRRLEAILGRHKAIVVSKQSLLRPGQSWAFCGGSFSSLTIAP